MDSFSIIYELIKEDKSLRISITDDYINVIKEPSLNDKYGWFCYKNGFEVELPKMEHFLDSLKKSYTEVYISKYNGLISIYNEGKKITES